VEIGEVDEWKMLSQRLANLQLLDGTTNREKLDSLPAAWIAKQYTEEESKAQYLDRHCLTNLTDSISGFRKFYGDRREQLVTKLRSILM
jgi:hypothetical protein